MRPHCFCIYKDECYIMCVSMSRIDIVERAGPFERYLLRDFDGHIA